MFLSLIFAHLVVHIISCNGTEASKVGKREKVLAKQRQQQQRQQLFCANYLGRRRIIIMIIIIIISRLLSWLSERDKENDVGGGRHYMPFGNNH